MHDSLIFGHLAAGLLGKLGRHCGKEVGELEKKGWDGPWGEVSLSVLRYVVGPIRYCLTGGGYTLMRLQLWRGRISHGMGA